MVHQVVAASLLAMTLLLGAASPVLGDEPVKESMDLGTVCAGRPWADTETWFVGRSPEDPQFPDGAELRLTVLGVTEPPVATYAITLEDDTVRLPTDWTALPGDGSVTSHPDGWRYAYVLTGLTEGRRGLILVTWGVSADGGPVRAFPSTLSISIGAPCPEDGPDPGAAPTLPATDAREATGPGSSGSDPALVLVLMVAAATLVSRRRLPGHAGRVP